MPDDFKTKGVDTSAKRNVNLGEKLKIALFSIQT